MSSFEIANLFSVKDKVVVVTGGCRGVGKMVCFVQRLNDLLTFALDRYGVRQERCKGLPMHVLWNVWLF